MDSQTGKLLLDVLCGRLAGELPPADLEKVLDLATAHGLVGHVHESLTQAGKDASKSQQFFDDTAIRTKVQLQSAVEIANAMRAAAIPCVFAKGVAFNVTIYETPGVRPFNDQDLLIRPEDLRKADEALRNIGFVPSNNRGNPIELSYRRERLPGFLVSIDLHWDFASSDSLQAAERMPVAEIVSRAQIAKGISVPAPEDSLLLAASNFIRKSAFPVMLIADFARLAKLPMDWAAVASRAKAWGLSSGVWLGLVLAKEMFGSKLPDEVAALQPSAWRRNWLLKHTDRERVWTVGRESTFRYRILFKLKCLNSFGELLIVAGALPKAVFRKTGLSRSLAADLPK